MNYFSIQILNLTRQLFPKGRTYWIPPANPGTGELIVDESEEFLEAEDGSLVSTEDYAAGGGGIFEKLVKSFGGGGTNTLGTLERFRSDSKSILDSMLPDNPNFTDGTVNPDDNDCNDWERRLGLIQYGITSATTPTRLQRMAAIKVKMAYPGSASPRQSAGYLQTQLRAAGFDVYVYENLSALTPAEVLSSSAGTATYGSIDYGETDYGATWATYGISIIANHIDESLDADFAIDPTLHSTFFIAGPTISSFAVIPAIRKNEFRQMLLRLKPLHEEGFLFITYT